jgi:hypothetical protein
MKMMQGAALVSLAIHKTKKVGLPQSVDLTDLLSKVFCLLRYA